MRTYFTIHQIVIKTLAADIGSAVKKALSILSERKPCPPQEVPPLTEYSCVSFGYTLTILRRAQGLTPRKVAEFLGVSREHLEAIETGAELPDICLTRKLAEILGCSLKYLTVHHIRDQLRRSGLKLEGRIRVA